MRSHYCKTACSILLATTATLSAAPPRVAIENCRLERVVSEPTIVTPVGLAFNARGQLLVVESHTHQRPDEYEGPDSDRVRLATDTDRDGRLDQWSTFAEGFRHAMNVLVRGDGGVYVVSRGSVVLLVDRDEDGQADERRELLRLETETDYPHNALSGIALKPDGTGLLIGLGENFGDWYRLVGSDGKAIEGQGGRGLIVECGLDGSGLKTYASGFWNPFSICFDSVGRVFTVDNDPDASPPCRLLHVVPGGDYGFIWQYTRAGTHPLQAWDGQLPGTLPMVAGTGEAPTAILAHRGRLWVTSWGEHRIECYRLVPRGASFTAEREVLVQGDADFRPTGMALAPDGSLYFGDWVKRDYEVHGQGRIWRLTLPPQEEEPFPPTADHERRGDASLELALQSPDPYERTAAVWALSRSANLELHPARRAAEAGVRLGWLEALRRQETHVRSEILREALADASADVRLYAVRWIADDRLVELRDPLTALLEGPQPSARYYLSVLGAVDWLDHEPTLRKSGITDELLVRELRNPNRSHEARALALRLLSPESKFLTLARLRGYLYSEYPPLRLEAVRSLALKTDPQRFGLLAEIARDESQPPAVRSEAIAGLGGAATEHRNLLEEIARRGSGTPSTEAERVLRLAQLSPPSVEHKPPAEELERWVELLNGPGDAEAGRRLFFSAVGARCGVCHQHGGRGGRIGPDLTQLASSTSRERIIASILQPSQEMAPHYQPWLLVTSDGKTHTGLRMPEGGDDGLEEYADSEGNLFTLRSEMVEHREASPTSIMPAGLEQTISVADLRDLIAFLTDE